MVHIGQPRTTYGQLLGETAGQSISQALGNMMQQRQQRQQLQGLSPLFEQLGMPKEGISELLASGIDPGLAANLALQLGKQRSTQQLFQQKENVKHQEKLEKKTEAQAGLQNVINSMGSMVAKNIPGVGVSPLTAAGVSRKGVEGRSQFNSMRARIESVLVPLVNKGQMSDTRFNFIMTQVPKANESQRAIVGKLRGLANSLSQEGFPIDTKVIDEIPWASEELKAEQNGPSSEQAEQSQFEVGQSFQALPKASDSPGAVFRKGNKRYVSNGKTWKEVK